VFHTEIKKNPSFKIMNSLVLLSSLVFGLNTTSDTKPNEVSYVDVETVSHVYNNQTKRIETVLYIEQQEEISLGFNTAEYLPVGFDANEANSGINKAEFDALFEEEIVFNFDITSYLPMNFDPYSNTEEITDEELDMLFQEEVELGFNVKKYLPKYFNAYEGL